jgi:polar amino acid transport system permease protein
VNAALFLSPTGWSRERRTVAVMAMALSGMIVFLWLLDVPLATLPEPIGSAASQFAAGARITIALTAVAGMLGVVLGMLAALGKLSRLAPLSLVATFYVAVIRGTPLLVQVLFVFLAVPALVPGLQLSDFTSAVVALGFNAGAYNAEAIRAGILAVHKGQTEAARSLGLTPFLTFRDVVFPQALRIALPSLVNNTIALLKDSSLAYVIGVVELTNIGNRVQAATFQPIPVFVTTACIYLILTTILTQVSGAVERHLDVERQR